MNLPLRREKAAAEYQNIRKKLGGEAVLYGRTTAEETIAKGPPPDLSAYQGGKIPKIDFIANTGAEKYLAVLDPEGGLGWKKPFVEGRGPGYDGAHIVELVTVRTPDAYLAYLQKIGISYLICGEDHLNCTQAMEKLYEQFVVRTALLQGGGLANAAFAAEGLIDELSLVIAPSLQGGGVPCLMESVRGLPPNSYVLCGIQTLPGGGLWLRYTKK